MNNTLKLNTRQKEAVRYINGPLLIIAGPGSGKTCVITHKIAWLINEYGIAPQHITAVTFSNRAAREMKSRVSALLNSKKVNDLNVLPFHALGLSIIQHNQNTLGYCHGFSIYNTEDSLALITRITQKTFPRDARQASEIQQQISHWKRTGQTHEMLCKSSELNGRERTAAHIYRLYAKQLKTYNAVDFDDLILLSMILLKNSEEILDFWRNRIRYLLVDEYQDTNPCQHELVKLLVGHRGALTVAGDDDQSIYGSRGAKPENLIRLRTDFPKLTTIKLERNYRSPGRVLKAANALIKNNGRSLQKSLWGRLSYGEAMRVIKTRNEEHEAECVVSELLRHKSKHNSQFHDYAILFRSNVQSRIFERALHERRIPYFLHGANSFFERLEIKDILAYLKLITNTDDNNSFFRVINTPRREIDPLTLEKLANYANDLDASLVQASFDAGLEQHLNNKQLSIVRDFTRWVIDISELAETDDPVKAVHTLLNDIGYSDWLSATCNDRKVANTRMDNVMELIALISDLAKRNSTISDKRDKTLGDIITYLCLLSLIENGQDEVYGDYVSLMSLHATKGLEFPHVIMVGMEEEILPYSPYLHSGEQGITEERRLAYVGITRAQQSLTFSIAARRKRNGEVAECEPSRFLLELPQDDILWNDPDDECDQHGPLECHQTYTVATHDILD